MSLPTERGPPHFLITVSCNPNHPAIQIRLRPGDTAFSQPDVTARVFHSQMQSVIPRVKQLFGLA